MNEVDLAAVEAGFSHLSLGSQTVFRAALDALSHPGRLVDVVHDAHVPPCGHAASAALLLALMDSGNCLWLSPSLAGGHTAAWLRFHTGCTLVSEPATADFAWAANANELPSLDCFAQGSDSYPDRSATCLLDVPALCGNPYPSAPSTMPGPSAIREVAALSVPAEPLGNAPLDRGWLLRGPGIRDCTRLRVVGLPRRFTARFESAWAANHASFPRGVDLFLAAPRRIAGLPRTTRIDFEA